MSSIITWSQTVLGYLSSVFSYHPSSVSSMIPIVDTVCMVWDFAPIIKLSNIITIPLLSDHNILFKQNYLHWAFFSFWTGRTCTEITNCWITIWVFIFRRYITLTPVILPWFWTGLVIYAVFLTLTRRQFLHKYIMEKLRKKRKKTCTDWSIKTRLNYRVTFTGSD